MGKRLMMIVNKAGEVERVAVESTPPGASLQQRIDALEAVAGEHSQGEPILQVRYVYCDQCGASAELGSGTLELPDGWTSGPDGERCQACSP